MLITYVTNRPLFITATTWQNRPGPMFTCDIILWIFTENFAEKDDQNILSPRSNHQKPTWLAFILNWRSRGLCSWVFLLKLVLTAKWQ
jgi:hypothetical protein